MALNYVKSFPKYVESTLNYVKCRKAMIITTRKSSIESYLMEEKGSGRARRPRDAEWSRGKPRGTKAQAPAIYDAH